jgi:hypothetical protein
MCSFFVNNLFPFPLATALFIGDVMMNRRCYVNPLQIWSAVTIQDMNTSAPIYWHWHVISDNTIGVVNVHIFNRQSGSNRKLVLSYWPKIRNAWPIYKAVATGNGKDEFYRETHVETANNPRSPQCQTEAELLFPSWPPSFSLLSTFKLSILKNILQKEGPRTNILVFMYSSCSM